MQMRFSAAEQSEVWDRFEAGESMRSIARSVGRSQAAVRSLIQKTGGIRPLAPTVWSDARMSLAEREPSDGATRTFEGAFPAYCRQMTLMRSNRDDVDLCPHSRRRVRVVVVAPGGATTRRAGTPRLSC